MSLRTLDPADLSNADLYAHLTGVVVPRPIAFVSTVDEAGQPNLAPYSFFNVVSTRPPICLFSAVTRAGDTPAKDTLYNVQQTGECVIHIVPYDLVQQMALCSVEYARGDSEFTASGLSTLPAQLVKPPRVAECPVQLECRVQQIIPLGNGAGAGNLVVCEIVLLHMSESIFNEAGQVDPHRLDAMGRMGRAFYVRASGEAVHRIYQDRSTLGMGFAALPSPLRESEVLTGNDLAHFARRPLSPTSEEVQTARIHPQVVGALEDATPVLALHRLAQRAIARNEVDLAAAIAWLSLEV